MTDRQLLAHNAVRRALSLRHSLGISPNRPVQIYDLVDRLGIELRFLDVPSMEGLYYKDSHAILVTSLRPRGRRAFTCAHELGHHVFGHGTRLDLLLSESGYTGAFDPDEYVADRFASALLMPKAAVDWAFRSRGWTFEHCRPEHVYTIAGWLNVGYETLVRQLTHGFHLISSIEMERLLRCSPQQIRRDLLGFQPDSDLLVADEYWQDRAIDIEEGDLIIAPSDLNIDGTCVETMQTDSKTTILRGITPGRGRVITIDGRWAAYIRVSRRGYVGRSIFMHLEDPSDE